MKKFAILTTFTALTLGSAAFAGPVEDIVAQLQDYGYSNIETSQNGNTVTVEASRNGVSREVVYDLASDSIISDQTGDGNGDAAPDASATGSSSTDVEDQNDSEDDNGNDDENDSEDDNGHDGGNDDGGNDDGGSNDGGDENDNESDD